MSITELFQLFLQFEFRSGLQPPRSRASVEYGAGVCPCNGRCMRRLKSRKYVEKGKRNCQIDKWGKATRDGSHLARHFNIKKKVKEKRMNKTTGIGYRSSSVSLQFQIRFTTDQILLPVSNVPNGR